MKRSKQLVTINLFHPKNFKSPFDDTGKVSKNFKDGDSEKQSEQHCAKNSEAKHNEIKK